MMSPNLVPGRTCGACTLCCKVLAVAELDKPPTTLCEYCDVGQGCRIYDRRPQVCRSFFCSFLTNRKLREEWRPSKSRIVLVASPDGSRIGAHVDPERPGAWRREPFYSTLKSWALAAHARPDRRIGQVFITIGQQTIVMLPDRLVDVGIVTKDEVVITHGKPGPKGLTFDAFKIKRDDPRAGPILAEIEANNFPTPLF